MKRLKHLKNIEIALILALLALGVLLPWHSPFFGGNTASTGPSDNYEGVESGLLAQKATIPTDNRQPDASLAISQGNTVLSSSQVPEQDNEKETGKRTMNVVVTAYSSTVDQTSGNPHITAAGTRVERGVVANNLLPFGTKIQIPELYGDETFTVEDRFHWSKGDHQVDIWFPSREEAEEFGVKRTQIKIVN